MDRVCWLGKKGSRLSKPSARGNFSASASWSARPKTGSGARSTPMRVHRNVFWQLSRDGHLHGSGMPHATTASPKESSFRAPWRVGDALSAEEMLDGEHQRVDIPAYARIAYKSPLLKRLEEELCCIVPLPPPPSRLLNRSLDWTELNTQHDLKLFQVKNTDIGSDVFGNVNAHKLSVNNTILKMPTRFWLADTTKLFQVGKKRWNARLSGKCFAECMSQSLRKMYPALRWAFLFRKLENVWSPIPTTAISLNRLSRGQRKQCGNSKQQLMGAWH